MGVFFVGLFWAHVHRMGVFFVGLVLDLWQGKVIGLWYGLRKLIILVVKDVLYIGFILVNYAVGAGGRSFSV